MLIFCIIRDYHNLYHKVSKRILESVPAVFVDMSKFDLRMILVYQLWEQPTANLYFANAKIFIYYFNNHKNQGVPHACEIKLDILKI